MSRVESKVETFVNPAGFVEQSYVGPQTAESIESGIKAIKRCAKKLQDDKKSVLILINTSEVVTNFDRLVHMAGIKGMRSVKFSRGAIYGSLPTQVAVNTLAIVAGLHRKVRAFDERSAAIKWLQGAKPAKRT